FPVTRGHHGRRLKYHRKLIGQTFERVSRRRGPRRAPPARPRPDAGAADTPRHTTPDAPRRPGAAPPNPTPPEGERGKTTRTEREERPRRGREGLAPHAGGGAGRAPRAAAPPAAARAQPRSHLSPTDPALRANPYPEVTDLTCPTSLTPPCSNTPEAVHRGDRLRIWSAARRETYTFSQFFKGRRELTGRRRNRGAFQGVGPSLGTNPFQGARPFTKRKENSSRGPPPALPGSFALPHWAPRGARLRHSGFWDLNQTPFRSAGGDGGHRPSLPNGVRPSLRTD
uniref:Uncharacterized protein n=1 Tax=Cyprinus carpio carpio TaxID=630221 RepID=A0A9J7WV04_CYPCA